jgi:hypothetical protein
MPEIVYAPWRDENQKIKYPFSDTATLENDDGVAVDGDLFDDARVYPIGGTVGIFLNRITIAGSTVTFAVGDPVSGELASGSYDVNSAPDEVALFDVHGRPAGILVSDSQRLGLVLSSYGEGEFLFEVEQTEFAPSVVIPLPQAGLRGVLLDDGSFLAGDIYIVGADGIVVSLEGGFVRVDALGDPYARVEACDEEGVPLQVFCGLKTINGISPDVNGDFKLSIGANEAGQPILRLEVDEEGNVNFKTLGISTGLSNA